MYKKWNNFTVYLARRISEELLEVRTACRQYQLNINKQYLLDFI
jgi:hypothetical protein